MSTPAEPTATTPTPLFGGALTALLPPELIDVSTFRQVPDNQEVWVDASASTTTQNDSASLIIELLHLDPDVSPDALATFHLSQVLLAAQAGDQEEDPQYELLDASAPPAASLAISRSGFPVLCKRVIARVNHLHKFNRTSDTKPVVMLLWVVRIPHVETDVVVTWNLPQGVLGPGVPGVPGTPREVVGDAAVSPAVVQRCEAVVRSLSVEDWGLFC